jgi:hypothetical protein
LALRQRQELDHHSGGQQRRRNRPHENCVARLPSGQRTLNGRRRKTPHVLGRVCGETSKPDERFMFARLGGRIVIGPRLYRVPLKNVT